MIPKIIHYCWFGHGRKSEQIQKCIASWKKNLPDYEIVEWNESNFDVNVSIYSKQAYEARKWAFVSDYARLYVLKDRGGIYLDTDMEILKPLDEFLDGEMFLGFETNDIVQAGVIGACPKNQFIQELLSVYDSTNFLDENGTPLIVSSPVILTNQLRKHGLKLNGKFQKIAVADIYPGIIFSPNNLSRIWNRLSSKSYTVHHAEQSWIDNPHGSHTFLLRVRRYLVGVLRNIIGTDNTCNIKNVSGLLAFSNKK